MAVTVFLDTSVLLAGLVDFGPQSAPAQKLLHGVSEQKVKPRARPGTAASSSSRFRRGCLPSSASQRAMPCGCSKRKYSRAWPSTICPRAIGCRCCAPPSRTARSAVAS